MEYGWGDSYDSYDSEDKCDFSELLGKTVLEIQVCKDELNQDEINFITEEGKYVMTHEQDCCESVYIEEIVGDLMDLVGSPILMAEESSNEGETEWEDTYTWTFYKLATNKGYVTIRWYGESNGYYSEEVDMYFIKDKRGI